MADFKSRNPTRLAITPDAFNSGNALSFENQPALQSLFEVLRNGETPITFVLGAGVSVDAGFPTWEGLVTRLADEIKDPALRSLAKLDDDTPMRHAESIFRMISADDPDVDAGTLRKALYKKMPITDPGPIALSIARIWVARTPRIRLLTTNFDDVIEEALDREPSVDGVQSFAMYSEGVDEDDTPKSERKYRGIRDWESHLRAFPDDPGVLHLHGMTRRRKDPLRPVVLSESHFLYHGPQARKVVRRELKRSAVVFIGVSLGDPNLVGPLWDISRKYRHDRKFPRFVLHVPSAVRGAVDVDQARSYVLRKYEYMEDGLGVTPVFFKSYSQLFQALSELNLAIRHKGYFDLEPPRLVYGERFSQTLRSAWRSVGSTDGEVTASNLASRQAVSDGLANLLQLGSPLGELLRRPSARIQKRHGVLRRSSKDYRDTSVEDFGLFLWLRTLPPDGSADSAPYALSLAASSVYTHREKWSFDRTVAVEPESGVPVAKSVYSGLLTIENLPRIGGFSVWNGVWAIPFRMPSRPAAGESGDDVVTLGAIALNSTHFVRPNKKSAAGRASVLAAIQESQSDTEAVRELLESGVSTLLSSIDPIEATLLRQKGKEVEKPSEST